MKHIIDGIEVNIDWEQVEVIDNHGSGCVDWVVQGYDEDNKEYFGDGNYQDDELTDVIEIETAEHLRNF